MTDQKSPVLMAQIGAPHGIRGEVRVKSFTEDPTALGDYGSLFDDQGRKFKVVRLRPSKNVIIVKFKGINSREEAEKLNRVELFIDRSRLPDDVDQDEFYVTDLIGMDVIDEKGSPIGTVVTVPDFGAGSLLEIAPLSGGESSFRTWFLEFTRHNVPEIDLEKRVITARLPEEVSERDEIPTDSDQH